MEKHDSLMGDQTFIRIWAAALLVLILLTWRLWFPGYSSFPRVPIVDLFAGSPQLMLHWFAAVGLVVGLLATVLRKQTAKPIFIFIAASLATIFCFCNQHCLQPWAWQGMIIAVLLAGLPIGTAKQWIARVVISIYFYSAIGKFDYQFVHTTGQEFLGAIFEFLGVGDSVSQQLKSRLVLMFPIGELLVAIGLMFAPTRKIAAYLAIALHLVLILILSPIGMAHQWPVVIWNAVSILFVVWLFLCDPEPVENTGEVKKSTTQRLCILFAIVVLVGPLLRPLQLWDHWLAWGLYSPSNSRVDVFVSELAADRLDDSFRNYLVDSQATVGSQRFAMDRWSLEELGAPIYPQARFQRAAAIEWLNEKKLKSQATIVQYGPSHPWTGERSRIEVELCN